MKMKIEVYNKHRYPKNRASRKGKTSYDIYLEKRQALKDKDFALRPALSEEEFYKLRANAKRAGINNFMRDLPLSERYTDKKIFYSLKREMKKLDDLSEEGQIFKEKFKDITFEEFKSWDNKQWAAFRDDFIANGGTFDQFRGIYES